MTNHSSLKKGITFSSVGGWLAALSAVLHPPTPLVTRFVELAPTTENDKAMDLRSRNVIDAIGACSCSIRSTRNVA